MKGHVGICLALMLILAVGTVQGDAGSTLSASSELGMNLQNSDSTVLLSTTSKGNPVEAVLSVPQLSVKLNIRKEKPPLLTVSSTPCQNICHDKCSMHLEKHCLNITVPKKDCSIGKKVNTKLHCEKKCKPKVTLNLPEFHISSLPAKADSNTNPSAPPPAVVDTNVETPVTENQELHGLAEAAGNLLDHFDEEKKPINLAVSCQEVCVSVPIILPELVCTEQMQQVVKCAVVPEKTCEQECKCIPQKTFTLTKPAKPTLSLGSAQTSKRSLKGDVSVTVQDVDKMPVTYTNLNLSSLHENGQPQVVLPKHQVKTVTIDLSQNDTKSINITKAPGTGHGKLEVKLPENLQQEGHKVTIDATKAHADPKDIQVKKAKAIMPSLTIKLPPKENNKVIIDLTKEGEDKITKEAAYKPALQIKLPHKEKKPLTIDLFPKKDIKTESKQWTWTKKAAQTAQPASAAQESAAGGEAALESGSVDATAATGQESTHEDGVVQNLYLHNDVFGGQLFSSTHP